MPEHCWHMPHAAYTPNFGDWGQDGNSITGDSEPAQWDTLPFPEYNPQRVAREPYRPRCFSGTSDLLLSP